MQKKFYEEFKIVYEHILCISKLMDKTVFIAGSTGLIGRYLVEFFMFLNINCSFNITIIANSRSFTSIRKYFNDYISNKNFRMHVGDINYPIKYFGKVDYIINCASNTHPLQYANDPIGTIMTNVQGTKNLLDLAVSSKTLKFLFLSSVEIYGENRYGVEKFKESDIGYIDCNTLRAGYNEAKRTGETLCQAYIENKKLDVSIVRLPRTFGPTAKRDDSKVLSQFIASAIIGMDIVLKSKGEQFFSYLYVADAISGMLTVLLNGKNGEVYNLGNDNCDIRLKDLAKMIADYVGVKVVFELPSEVEKKGFSKAVDARLDYSKIQKELEWEPYFDMENGIRRTIDFLRNK